MKKSDLKTGMIVETNSRIFLVYKDITVNRFNRFSECETLDACIYNTGGWDKLDDACPSDDSIIKVFIPMNVRAAHNIKIEFYFNLDEYRLIYERDETYEIGGVKYTREELEKLKSSVDNLLNK